MAAAYIRTQSNRQLTRVDVHMNNGMEKPMRQIARRAAATPHLVTLAVRAAACAGALALLGGQALAQAPNADQATRMYNRIAGVPPGVQSASLVSPSRCSYAHPLA